MAYLRIVLWKNLFIDSLVEHFMKMLNASIFSFIILNLAKKSILDFHVNTATDIGMKEVIDSCLRRAFWRKIIETLNVVNFATKGLSFYYTVISTGRLASYRTLRYKQSVVPFIDSNSRPEVFLKFSWN